MLQVQHFSFDKIVHCSGNSCYEYISTDTVRISLNIGFTFSWICVLMFIRGDVFSSMRLFLVSITKIHFNSSWICFRWIFKFNFRGGGTEDNLLLRYYDNSATKNFKNFTLLNWRGRRVKNYVTQITHINRYDYSSLLFSE